MLLSKRRLSSRQVALLLGYSVKSVSNGSGELSVLTPYQIRPGSKRLYDAEQVEQLRQRIQAKEQRQWRER